MAGWQGGRVAGWHGSRVAYIVHAGGLLCDEEGAEREIKEGLK